MLARAMVEDVGALWQRAVRVRVSDIFAGAEKVRVQKLLKGRGVVGVFVGGKWEAIVDAQVMSRERVAGSVLGSRLGVG